MFYLCFCTKIAHLTQIIDTLTLSSVARTPEVIHVKLSCCIYFLHKAHRSLPELKDIMYRAPFKQKDTDKNTLHSTGSRERMCYLKLKQGRGLELSGKGHRLGILQHFMVPVCECPMSVNQNPSHTNRAVNKFKTGDPPGVESISSKGQPYFLFKHAWSLLLDLHSSLV